MKIMLFILANLAAFASSGMLSDIWFNRQGRWFRFLSVLSLFVIEIVLMELCMGLFGCLNAKYVCLAAVSQFIVISIIWFSIYRRRSKKVSSPQRFLLVPVLLMLGFLLGMAAGQYAFQGTHFCQDDLSYHATAAAHWYLEENITAGPMNYHYHKQFNAELFSLWFMLFLGQDGLVFLAGIFWMVFTCTAGIVLMQNMNINRRWFAPVMVALFYCSVITHQVMWTFTAVDLAGPAMILAVIAFLTSISSAQKNQWSYILLAGLCAGFAFGTKMPFVAVFAVLSVWVYWMFKGSFRNRFGYMLLFIIAACVMGSYWYIRNLVLTGNPFFPGQLGPFPGPLTREIQFNMSILGHIVNSGYDSAVILEILRRHINWPAGIFVLSIAGYIAGIVSLFRREQSFKNISLLILAAAVMLMTYFVMPFSRQVHNEANAPLDISLRFIIGPLMIGLILFSLLLDSKSFLRWGWYCLYGVGLILAVHAHRDDIQVAAGGAALVWLLWFSLKPRWNINRSVPEIACLILLLPGVLWGLTRALPILQSKTDIHLYQNKKHMPMDLFEVWQKINTFPPGSHITAFGPVSYTYYPLYGRQFQLCPRILSVDATPFVPLYCRWNASQGSLPWWSSQEITDTKKWEENLIHSGIEYVIVQRPAGAAWTKPYEILQGSSAFQCIGVGNDWTLWKRKL